MSSFFCLWVEGRGESRGRKRARSGGECSQTFVDNSCYSPEAREAVSLGARRNGKVSTAGWVRSEQVKLLDRPALYPPPKTVTNRARVNRNMQLLRCSTRNPVLLASAVRSSTGGQKGVSPQGGPRKNGRTIRYCAPSRHVHCFKMKCFRTLDQMVLKFGERRRR